MGEWAGVDEEIPSRLKTHFSISQYFTSQLFLWTTLTGWQQYWLHITISKDRLRLSMGKIWMNTLIISIFLTSHWGAVQNSLFKLCIGRKTSTTIILQQHLNQTRLMAKYIQRLVVLVLHKNALFKLPFRFFKESHWTMAWKDKYLTGLIQCGNILPPWPRPLPLCR